MLSRWRKEKEKAETLTAVKKKKNQSYTFTAMFHKNTNNKNNLYKIISLSKCHCWKHNFPWLNYPKIAKNSSNARSLKNITNSQGVARPTISSSQLKKTSTKKKQRTIHIIHHCGFGIRCFWILSGRHKVSTLFFIHMFMAEHQSPLWS